MEEKREEILRKYIYRKILFHIVYWTTTAYSRKTTLKTNNEGKKKKINFLDFTSFLVVILHWMLNKFKRGVDILKLKNSKFLKSFKRAFKL